MPLRCKCYLNFREVILISKKIIGRKSFETSVQPLSRVRVFVTPCTDARQACPCVTNSRSSLKLRSTESVMPSNHLILYRPLLFLPSIFPSIRVFSHESVLCIRWPKYWSFSFSISPSNKYSGLISFRMDWLDLLAVQGTLKSLLQHHSSKASILQRSAFFMIQLTPIHDHWTKAPGINMMPQEAVSQTLCFASPVPGTGAMHVVLGVNQSNEMEKRSK